MIGLLLQVLQHEFPLTFDCNAGLYGVVGILCWYRDTYQRTYRTYQHTNQGTTV